MGVDPFRLGIGIVLISLMFPLVDLVDKYIDSETAGITLFLWLLGSLLVLASGLRERCSSPCSERR